MYKNLLDTLKKYDKITIFRHARPDGDCIFSSLALYYFLKDNFKDKKIKLAGKDVYDVISKIENVSDDFINNSLAIALDTATIARIDDKRVINALKIVKIDHHPPVENYGDINIVDHNASATCELLTTILTSKEFSKYKISNKVYEYLYCGMITDTLNFKTANTTAKTLSIASKLVEKGGLKPSNLNELLFDVNLDTYKKITEIRNSLKVNKKFGYVLLTKKQLESLKMDPVEAKNQIDAIGNIKDLNIWAFAVQNSTKYDISVRSKRKYIINTICAKYNGGGHANAAATRQISKQDLDKLIKELIEISTK